MRMLQVGEAMRGGVDTRDSPSGKHEMKKK
jgi:hypothetical protein